MDLGDFMIGLHGALIGGLAAFKAARTEAAVEEARAVFVGVNGQLSQCLEELALVDDADRPIAAKWLTYTRRRLLAAFERAQRRIEGPKRVELTVLGDKKRRFVEL